MRKVLACVLMTTWCVVEAAFAHSIPTHLNLTKRTAQFLGRESGWLKNTEGCVTQLSNALSIGAEHEDDWFNDEMKYALGRFLFHFYPTLTDGGIKPSCDSRTWAGFSGNRTVECVYTVDPRLNEELAKHGLRAPDGKAINENTYMAAIADAQVPHSHTDTCRNAPNHSGFSQGVVRLGYVLHLMQDLTSPAHSRNSAHGYLGGVPYPAQPALLGGPDPMEVTARGHEYERDLAGVPAGHLIKKAPEALFSELHVWVANNFFSSKTIFSQPGPIAHLDEWRVRRKAGCFAVGKDCKKGDRHVAYHDPRPAGPGGAGPASPLSDGTSLTISYAVADKQWNELAPRAVQYGASLVDAYVTRHEPVLPAECRL